MNYTCNNLVWLGVVPEHWKVLKLRQILSPVSEKNHPDLPLLSVVREKGVIIRNIEDRKENHNYVPDDLSGYKLVKIGQFAMNKMKAWQGSYGVSGFDGIVSPAYFVFDIPCDLNSDFFNRAIRSMVYVNYFGQASDGIRVGQWDLSMQRMKEIPFLLPPRSEQDQIVRFLDWKVSSINRLINIKRKEIVALGELKQNIITNCITTGLNRNVEMKYSGNEWINYIPWHWTTVQLRRVYTVILGKMLSPMPTNGQDSYEEYVCAKDVHFDGVDLSSLKKMWFSQMEKNQYEIRKGDLLIVEGGAGAGNAAIVYDLCGKSIYVQNSIHIVRSKSNQAINKFLCYWISSLVKRGYMKNICSVATIPHYTKDKVLSTMMPLPPIEEQTDIVDYLDMKCAAIDNIIAKKHKQIQLLQELKARLTADAVTGKIDVRGIEIPKYEFVEDSIDKENYENIETMEGDANEE